MNKIGCMHIFVASEIDACTLVDNLFKESLIVSSYIITISSPEDIVENKQYLVVLKTAQISLTWVLYYLEEYRDKQSTIISWEILSNKVFSQWIENAITI